MQTQFNIHVAKTYLSKLVDQVEAGGEAVIARAGKPVVRLMRIDDAPKPRVLGRLAGRCRLPEDPSTPLPDTPEDFLDAVEGC
jgi:prevent-host-death family protein